jgi:hypothetical protein
MFFNLEKKNVTLDLIGEIEEVFKLSDQKEKRYWSSKMAFALKAAISSF